MKDDERELLKAVLAGEKAYDAADRLGIHWKRAQNFYERKWAAFWEYGVSGRTGWIQDRAKAEAYLNRQG